MLSRFRTAAQQRRALAAFAEGKVDVLVGTHRLLSADVNPNNLGLVIIDEEQRFGVQHKEQLKNLREQIDVLTLSATPIPRTMQMAISGVRDMSLITTPPTGRRLVIVHVGEYDPDVVSAAIRLELDRGGQVYYVSNRVKTIDDAVERVHERCRARVGVAHGKMSPREVEDVMVRQFATGKIDVLVATTIIESGIDSPHSNTLIIEDSAAPGLSAALPAQRSCGALCHAGLRVFHVPGRAAAYRRGDRAPDGAFRVSKTWAAACASPCATWRSAARARLWAPSSMATYPALALICSRRCWARPWRRRVVRAVRTWRNPASPSTCRRTSS